MNEIIVKWNVIYTKGITHYSTNQCECNNPRFVDDQVIIADSEDNLRRGVFSLRSTANILELKYYQKILK
jgi:hypothetical protein